VPAARVLTTMASGVKLVAGRAAAAVTAVATPALPADVAAEAGPAEVAGAVPAVVAAGAAAAVAEVTDAVPVEDEVEDDELEDDEELELLELDDEELDEDELDEEDEDDEEELDEEEPEGGNSTEDEEEPELPEVGGEVVELKVIVLVTEATVRTSVAGPLEPGPKARAKTVAGPPTEVTVLHATTNWPAPPIAIDGSATAPLVIGASVTSCSAPAAPSLEMVRTSTVVATVEPTSVFL